MESEDECHKTATQSGGVKFSIKRKRNDFKVNNNIFTKEDLESMRSFGVDILDDDGIELVHVDYDSSDESDVYDIEDKDQSIVSDEDEEDIPDHQRRKLDNDYIFEEYYHHPTNSKYTSDLNPFELLPDEIIVYICTFLPHSDLSRLGQTCSRLRRLSQDEILWPRLDMSKKVLEMDDIGHILMRGVRVLKLTSVSFKNPMMSKEMMDSLTHCKIQVEYLDLSMAFICPSNLFILLSCMADLKKLSLEGCEVNDSVCVAIARNSDLNTLNMALVEGLTSIGISSIVHSCQKLGAINLAWTKLCENSYHYIVNNINQKILSINLSGATYSLRERDAIILIERCRNIKELDLSDCLRIGPLAVATIALRLKDLISLSLSRCVRVTAQSLESLFILANLEHLTACRVIEGTAKEDLKTLLPGVKINCQAISYIARPTVGIRRTSIWLQPTH